jgi:hypothetical protein
VPRTLERSAVLRTLDYIDGDGAFDAAEILWIDCDLPSWFVARLNREPGGDLIWSLTVLRALAEHYQIEPAAFYSGRSRTARLLSAQIRERLDAATAADLAELAEARAHRAWQDSEAARVEARQ